MAKKETIILEDFKQTLCRAKRTAFVTRFIVLREKRRSRAHRLIEHLSWDQYSSAEEVAVMIRSVFKNSGESARSYEPDIRKALNYAKGLYFYFVPQYAERATNCFLDALVDYERSKDLLFSREESPDCLGWRMPAEIQHEISSLKH